MTREETLSAALKEAMDQLEKQNEYLEDLKRATLVVASVVGKKDGRILLQTSGKGLAEGEAPTTFNVEIGDSVLVHPLSGAITGKVTVPTAMATALVREVLDDERVMVTNHHGDELIAAKMPDLQVCAGDRVLMVGTAVRGVLPRKGDSPFLLREKGRVTWNDVKGQSKAVALLQETVEWPRKHKALFTKFNRRPSKGVLLSGPPGCGKTLLAKATVTALNSDSKEPAFFYVKGPEILSKWVGQAEGTIREIFAQARAHGARTKEQPILFIDEADAILRKRGTGISSDIGNTIVPQFLSEMDGLEDGGPLVLLATNEAGSLDPAVVRPGRIDVAVEVSRPDGPATVELFAYYLKGVPLAEKDEDYADFIAARIWQRDDMAKLRAGISGAVVANLVQDATTGAIRRLVANPKSKDVGLLRSDLADAAHSYVRSRQGTGA